MKLLKSSATKLLKNVVFLIFMFFRWRIPNAMKGKVEGWSGMSHFMFKFVFKAQSLWLTKFDTCELLVPIFQRSVILKQTVINFELLLVVRVLSKFRLSRKVVEACRLLFSIYCIICNRQGFDFLERGPFLCMRV